MAGDSKSGGYAYIEARTSHGNQTPEAGFIFTGIIPRNYDQLTEFNLGSYDGSFRGFRGIIDPGNQDLITPEFASRLAPGDYCRFVITEPDFAARKYKAVILRPIDGKSDINLVKILSGRKLPHGEGQDISQVMVSPEEMKKMVLAVLDGKKVCSAWNPVINDIGFMKLIAQNISGREALSKLLKTVSG